MKELKVFFVLLITFLLTNDAFAEDIVILKDNSRYEGIILNIYIDILCDTSRFVVEFRPKRFVGHFKLIGSHNIKILKRREFLVYDSLSSLNAKSVVDRFWSNERAFERNQYILNLKSKAIKGVKRYSLVLSIGMISSVAAGIKFNKGYNRSSNEKNDYYTEGGVFSVIAVSSFLHVIDMKLSGDKRNKLRKGK